MFNYLKKPPIYEGNFWCLGNNTYLCTQLDKQRRGLPRLVKPKLASDVANIGKNWGSAKPFRVKCSKIR